MEKWELAYYLIEAKKNIDTIMFMSQNKDKLNNISYKDSLKKCLSNFYINCGIVLDNYIKVSNEKKKNICERNEFIKKFTTSVIKIRRTRIVTMRNQLTKT